jgi:hypothetical protein
MDDTEWCFQLFSTAPQLRHVKIYRYRPRLMSIAFNQVEKLSLNQVETRHCRDILLRSSPILSHCTFQNMFSRNENLALVLPSLVSQVKFLKLSTDETLALSMFLDSLSLPVVQELQIDTVWFGLPRSSLISLSSRSGCSLHRFALHRCNCSASDLRTFFSAIPSLIELEVNDSRVPDGGLCQILDVSEAAVLPNLQTLQLVDPDDVDIPNLGSMVLSRWRNATPSGSGNKVARLLSVKVTINRRDYVLDQGGEVLALLQQLKVGEGLKISIRNGNIVIL